jgi:hypothetical protein
VRGGVLASENRKKRNKPQKNNRINKKKEKRYIQQNAK